MAFTESLTVRILGDSSQLRSELQSVVDDLRGLQGRLDGLSKAGEQIGQGMGRVSGAVRPLEQVSRLLSRITEQVQSLSRIPVTLNVQPALQSLAQLSRAIQAIAAQLRALSAIPVGVGGGPAGPVRTFAEGGLVTGRAGIDAVPAMLTAGEFVLNRRAAQRLGAGLLEALNRAPSEPQPLRLVRESAVEASSLTNNFGGITINVTRPANVSGIIRDLRLHGARVRNRRG